MIILPSRDLFETTTFLIKDKCENTFYISMPGIRLERIARQVSFPGCLYNSSELSFNRKS